MSEPLDDDGGAAFPRSAFYVDAGAATPNAAQVGMSLRDYFAGQVMAAAVASYGYAEVAARMAYRMADAMLIARDGK